MGRLTSIGWELNSLTAGVEVTSSQGSNDSISSTTLRSGGYGLRSQFSTNFGYNEYSVMANGTKHLFARVYIRITTAINAQIQILAFRDSGDAVAAQIRLNTDNTLELWNASAQIGSDSTALTVGMWYRVELEVDNTQSAGSDTIAARINGSAFASSSAQTLNNIQDIEVGGRDVSDATSGDLFFDDLAVNDDAGSFQNSYPGSGRIIHLKPNAAGDNSDWTNDYTNVDEVTPNDATDLVSSNTLDQIDDHNIESPNIASADTINVVQVGVRFNGAGASANASFVLRIKASASGTVEESSAITPSNTTWVTNAAASPRNYSLTLYDLPGGSTTAWTKSDLDSAQIGYRLSSTSTNAAQISTVWLLVDYTPNEPRLLRTYSGQNDASSSITISSVDCSGTNTYLVVKSGVEANTTPSDRPITGVTFNTSENLSQLVSQQFTSGGGEDDQVEIWGLVAPTATTADVVVTYTGAVDGCAVIVEVWENVLQSSSTEDPQSNGVTSTGPATITVTPTVDNTVIIGAGLTMSSSRTLTPSTGVEESGNFANSGQLKFAGGYRYVGPAAAKALAWTIDSSADWIIAAVALKPYVEAAPSNTHPGYYGGEGWF